MKEARDKAIQQIKQLERQWKNWLEENSSDQGDIVKLLNQREAKELQIAVIEIEIGSINDRIKDKYAEMEGENLVQMQKYDKLIKEAKARLESIL